PPPATIILGATARPQPFDDVIKGGDSDPQLLGNDLTLQLILVGLERNKRGDPLRLLGRHPSQQLLIGRCFAGSLIIEPFGYLARHLLAEGLLQRWETVGIAAIVVLLDGIAPSLHPIWPLLVPRSIGRSLQHQCHLTLVEPSTCQKPANCESCIMT